MSTRILMVTPNWNWDRSPLPVDTLHPPLGMPLEWAYLAGDLGPDVPVRILDAYATGTAPEDVQDAARSFEPSAVVVSTTPSMLYWRCPPLSLTAVRDAVAAVRAATDAPVVLIGPHGTFSPDWTLEVTGADACWRGAFERHLAGLLRSGAPSPHLATASRPGTIAVLAASDLPTASFAAFDPAVSYPPHMWCMTEAETATMSGLGAGALLEASRGCPWSCAYCAKGPVRDRYDRRPLDRIADELDQLARRGVGYVFLIDETFNMPGRGHAELLEVLAASPLTFGFQGRADLITPESAEALADSGCRYAELGVDVASDLLSAHLGRRQHLDKSRAGLTAAQRAIPVVRFNRLNLSTRDYRELYPVGDAITDWDFPPDPAYPYPGAPLGEALMRHYGRDDFDWGFAQRYSWWLRLEVHLQRTQPGLLPDAVAALQREFLAMDTTAAETLARTLEPLFTVPGFHDANKSIGGRKRDVRVRRSGPQ